MKTPGPLESTIRAEILRDLGNAADLALFVNAVGQGTRYGITDGAFEERTFRYGLGTGSPDLVGMLTVGGHARWFCLETKTAVGRLRPEQRRWAEQARARGAFVAVARSVAEARAALERARRGEVA